MKKFLAGIATAVLAGFLFFNFVYTEPIGSSVSQSTQTYEEEPEEDDFSEHVHQWYEAWDVVGEETIIQGMVVSVHEGNPTFLNIGADYPSSERFTVVIWEEDLAKFNYDISDEFLGREVYVYGVVEVYKGVPEIILRDPNNIVLFEY